MRRRRKSGHVIADIHYGRASRTSGADSWLTCTDGTRLEAESPEALAVLWQGHGGKAMAEVRVHRA